MTSTSVLFDKYKNSGSREYGRAHEQGIPYTLRKKRLEAALGAYQSALGHAKSCDQKASINWNLAAASLALCKVHLAGDDFLVFDNAKKTSTITRFVEDMVPSYGAALEAGMKSKEQDWIVKVEESFAKCVNVVIVFQRDTLAERGLRERFLWKAFSLMKDLPRPARLTSAFILFSMEFSRFLFAQSVSLQQLDVACLDSSSRSTRGFLSAAKSDVSHQQRLRAADEPLQMGLDAIVCMRKSSSSGFTFLESYTDRFKELEEDIRRSLDTADSLGALCMGQTQFLESLEGEEELGVEAMWAALDKLKESSILLRGKDIGLEAFVISRIAAILQALKVDDTAARYYKNVVELVLSINQVCPKLSQAWWYKEAVEKVAIYQHRKQEEEEALSKKEKEPYMRQLEAELEELKREKVKSAESFLKLLYSRHPPKDPLHQIGSLDREVMKKTLLRSVSHYHPDKNSRHGKLWEILCEEITKALNRKYEFYK